MFFRGPHGYGVEDPLPHALSGLPRIEGERGSAWRGCDRHPWGNAAGGRLANLCRAIRVKRGGPIRRIGVSRMDSRAPIPFDPSRRAAVRMNRCLEWGKGKAVVGRVLPREAPRGNQVDAFARLWQAELFPGLPEDGTAALEKETRATGRGIKRRSRQGLRPLRLPSALPPRRSPGAIRKRCAR